MKKNLQKALALTTVLSMVFGSSVLAAPDDITEVTGDSGLNDPIYSTITPTDLVFAVDPYEMASAGNQIKGTEFAIVNKSEVPIQMKVKVTVDATSAANLVAADKVYPNDMSKTTKDAYMSVVLPSAVAHSADDGDTPGAGTYDADLTANHNIPLKSGTDGTTFAFALDKATYTPAASEGDPNEFSAIAATKGEANFKLYGKLNTYAPWAAADIKLKLKYSYIGLTATSFTAITPIANTVQAMSLLPSTAGFADATVAATKGTDKVVDFYALGKTITSVVITENNYPLTSPNDYSFDSGTNKFTFKSDAGSAWSGTPTGSTWNIEVTMSDASTSTTALTLN